MPRKPNAKQEEVIALLRAGTTIASKTQDGPERGHFNYEGEMEALVKRHNQRVTVLGWNDDDSVLVKFADGLEFTLSPKEYIPDRRKPRRWCAMINAEPRWMHPRTILQLRDRGLIEVFYGGNGWDYLRVTVLATMTPEELQHAAETGAYL